MKKSLHYTATTARANLYSILKDAGTTYHTHEISQRNAAPVIVVNKEKYQRLLQYVPKSELAKFDEHETKKTPSKLKVKYPETLAVLQRWSNLIKKRTKGKKVPKEIIIDRERLYDEYMEENLKEKIYG